LLRRLGLRGGHGHGVKQAPQHFVDEPRVQRSLGPVEVEQHVPVACQPPAEHDVASTDIAAPSQLGALLAAGLIAAGAAACADGEAVSQRMANNSPQAASIAINTVFRIILSFLLII
jgi:hypothetical protein